MRKRRTANTQDQFPDALDPRLKMVPMPLDPNVGHILASAEACGVPPDLAMAFYKCMVGLAAHRFLQSRMLH